MSDTSEKTSDTRRRSASIIPEQKEASNPETTTAVTNSSSVPNIIVSTAARLSPSSHSGIIQEFKLPYYLAEWSTGQHQDQEHSSTKEDLRNAGEGSTKADRETALTPLKQKGKILTDEEEQQAVDEAYKALKEEEYTPPSR
ncbi:hypothetical protein MMC11_006457 [Xylographa trunciseda]|nr:hypothetical protein [Xylographa trunciseda]